MGIQNKVKYKEIISESSAEQTLANGIRVIRVFGVENLSGFDGEPEFANLAAMTCTELPKLYDKMSYSLDENDEKIYDLVMTKIWTKPDSHKINRIYTEWTMNSGVPMYLDSGFIMRNEGMLALQQYNHDNNGSGLRNLYVPPNMAYSDCSGKLPWDQSVLIDKMRPYLTRSYVGIATEDPYNRATAILGKVDKDTRTQLCTSFIYARRPDGFYDVKLMFAQELDGWDRVKVWKDQYGKVPQNIAEHMTEFVGWENGLSPNGKSGNGIIRPVMYDYFNTSGSWSGDYTVLPYEIASQFPLPIAD